MKKIVFALIGLATLTAAQAQETKTLNIQPNDPFITVNGKTLYTVAQFRQRLNNVIRSTGAKYSPELEHSVAENLVKLDVLSNYAKAQKYDQAPQFKEALTQAINQLTEQALADESIKQFLQKNPATESEISNAYQNMVVNNLKSQKEYEIEHVIVAKESEAKKFISDLRRKRTTFAKLSAKSIDPSDKANKGFISWKLSNEFVPELRTVLATMKKGQLYLKPIHTSFGYHVMKLVDVRPATIPPLAQVKSQLVTVIQTQKLNQLIGKLEKQDKVAFPIYEKIAQGQKAK